MLLHTHTALTGLLSISFCIPLQPGEDGNTVLLVLLPKALEQELNKGLGRSP